MGNSLPTIPDNVQVILDEREVRKPQLKILHKVFKKLDLNKDGKLDQEEFLDALSEKMTAITRFLFQLMDFQNDNSISFIGFLWGILTFGMYSHEQVVKFSFLAYDKDRRGAIKLENANELLQVAAKELPGVNPWDAGMKLDTNHDGKLDFEEFVQMGIQLPTTMHQAFRIQEKIRIKTLGLLWFNRQKSMDARRLLPRTELVKFLDGARSAESERKKLLRQKGGRFCKPHSRKGKKLLCQIADADTHGNLRQVCHAGISDHLLRESMKVPLHGIRGVFDAWQQSSHEPGDSEYGEDDSETERSTETPQAPTVKAPNIHHRSDRATRHRRSARRKAHKIAVFDQLLQRRDGLDHANDLTTDLEVQEEDS